MTWETFGRFEDMSIKEKRCGQSYDQPSREENAFRPKTVSEMYEPFSMPVRTPRSVSCCSPERGLIQTESMLFVPEGIKASRTSRLRDEGEFPD